MIRKTWFLIPLFSLFIFSLRAQGWDSTYYLKYTDKFCITFNEYARMFNLQLDQKLFTDTSFSAVSYTAEAKTGIGFTLDWDILGIAFGVYSFPGDETHKGKTDYSNFALSFGGAKYFLETSYRRYKGFYDVNSPNYDTAFEETGIYYQDPDLTATAGQVRFFYVFRNKKFAIKSAYTSTYRQLKSSASLIGLANFYYKEFTSVNGIVPRPLSGLYGDYETWSGLFVPGFSAGIGGSGNLVIGKRFLLNGTLAFALTSQWRHYSFLDKPSFNKTYLSPVGDSRFAISYNAPRFLISIYSKTDFSFYNSQAINLEARFISAELDIGYRFNLKDPSFMPKVRQWWVYKIFD